MYAKLVGRVLLAARFGEPAVASAGEAGTGPREYLHRELSRASGLARGRMVLFLERFAGQLQCFGDGRSRDRSSPLPNNFVPVHTFCHLLEHLRNPDAGTPHGRLTVADFGIGHDIPAESFLPHFGFPRIFLPCIIALASRGGQSDLDCGLQGQSQFCYPALDGLENASSPSHRSRRGWLLRRAGKPKTRITQKNFLPLPQAAPALTHMNFMVPRQFIGPAWGITPALV